MVSYVNIDNLNLLLKHICNTFNAQICIIWTASNNSIHLYTTKGSDAIIDKISIKRFLEKFYYQFLRSEKAPIIITNLKELFLKNEDIKCLFEIEYISTLFISPIFKNQLIKGVLVLGSTNKKYFKKIDLELLMILVNAFMNFKGIDGKSPTSTQRDSIDKKSVGLGLLIGNSSKMHEIYKTIIKISNSDANVLIYGESGTGKELIARTIHAYSKRKNQAFIPVDCVALPVTLLESELFGYEKGAFTGATNVKRGLIEYANKGTFFLDEITELNVELQSKLLRVLQERQFRRLGGKSLINVDIRIISATNRNPQEAVARKVLREDLFYRLNVIPIYVPPLRERPDDIPLLVNHFIKEFTKTSEFKQIEITDEALQILIKYPWPGNVRQLKNLIERIVALAKGEIIRVEDLPEEIIQQASNFEKTSPQNGFSHLPYDQAKKQSLLEFERNYFIKLFDKHNGNITKVAKAAKVSRKTIYQILKKHGLDENIVGKPVWHYKLSTS